MADYSYVLYDTQPTGTAVFDTLLFQVAQGADATHTEDFTNSRGAGALPSTERFVLEKIGLAFSPAIAFADLQAISVASFLQLRHLDITKLWCPFTLAFDNSNYMGVAAIAAAAGQTALGFFADGYTLEHPITINGGEKFAIRVKTTVATAASTKLVVLLYGVLTIP